MPYRIYSEGDTLRIDFDTVVTNEEFAAAVQELHQIESSGPAAPHRITDLSRSTGLNIKYPAIAAAARLRRAINFPNSFKSAIVAPEPVHLGLARMFATLNDHPQITIRIFPDLSAAQAWIAEG
jgi:hypothetical protein